MKRDPRRFDDLFQYFGPINVRPMFGGEGIYADGMIVAFVVNEKLYLKTGDINRADFLAEGCEAFSFLRGKKVMTTSYYSVPDRLLDNPEEFSVWARKAQTTSLAARTPRKKSR
ncbi:MAG TPA: TfoX/Sxy family protein [Rhizomicrobium sp.]|nr:TfoX/Sxy family protein [Rhizomicrobium sp.]